MDNIPTELRQRPQWVLWRWEAREGSDAKTKVPYTRGRNRADKTNPQAWTDYDQALSMWQLHPEFFDGVGYCFTADDPYTGIDLDHCITDVEPVRLERWADDLVRQLQSYTEISPSGTGLKAIVKAKLPGDRHVKVMAAGQRVEVYDQGWFFTITGNLYGSTTAIAERQTEIERVYTHLFPPDPVREITSSGLRPAFKTDQELMDKALAAKNGMKLAQLMWGDLSDYQGDHSRADSALCSLLAFYTADADQIDRIFRVSHLMRDKWTRRWADSTYGQKTIERALSLSPNHYVESNLLGIPSDYTVIEIVNTTGNGQANGHGGLEFRLESLKTSRWGGPSALVRAFQGDAELDYTRLPLEESDKRRQWASLLAAGDRAETTRIKRQLDLFCAEYIKASISYQDDVVFVPTIAEDDADYALKPYILNGEGTICFGPQSSGKTWLYLLMAVCLDAGISRFWEVPVRKNALVINFERDKRIMSKRLRRVNRFLGLPVDRPLCMLNCRGMNMNQMYDLAKQACIEHAIDVVFMDSILPAIAGPGVTIKDDEAANALMKQLTELCLTWLAVAHVTHSDPTRPIGSKVYSTAPGILVGVKSEDKRPQELTLGMALHMTKNNDGAGGIHKPQYWALDEVEPDIVWRPASEGEFSTITKLEKPEDGQKTYRKGLAERAYDWLVAHGNEPTGVGELADQLDCSKGGLHDALTKPGQVLVIQVGNLLWQAAELELSPSGRSF